MNPTTHFLKVDLSDENQIANVFNHYDFDIVIHLAAQPGIRLGIDGMKKYTQNNLVNAGSGTVSAAISKHSKFKASICNGLFSEVSVAIIECLS